MRSPMSLANAASDVPYSRSRLVNCGASLTCDDPVSIADIGECRFDPGVRF